MRFRCGSDRQNPRQIAAHFNAQAAVAVRSQYDGLDEGADDLRSFDSMRLVVVVVESAVELLDLPTVVGGHFGVQQGRRFAGARNDFLELLLALFEFDHFRVDALGRAAFEDEVEQSVEFAIDFLDLGARGFDARTGLSAEAVQFLGELIAEGLEQGSSSRSVSTSSSSTKNAATRNRWVGLQ